MKLIGKTTIHPAFFFSGKISGYILWILMGYDLITSICRAESFTWNRITAVFLIIAGLFLSVLSIIHLGRSTSLGLPEEATEFKTKGLYRFSRNPMYVGFNLLTIASMVNFLGLWITLTGFYSLLIYHFIILGEERFLKGRFGESYLSYLKKTRRYL